MEFIESLIGKFELLSYLDAIKMFFEAGDLVDILKKSTLFYLAILWFSIIIWVTKDIVSRSNNILVQMFSIIINCIPLLGLIIYLLIRPNKTLLESYYEEMEMSSLSDSKGICPHCEHCIDSDFVYCPKCKFVLKKMCSHCHALKGTN